MTARQTRAKIRRVARKIGTFADLAEELSVMANKNISGSGVYQWLVRGIIPDFWMPYIDKLDA